MRRFSTFAMAALVILALFWGNCFSCPQILLALDSHGCCHRTKPVKLDCQSGGFQHFLKAGTGASLPAMAVAAVESLPFPAVWTSAGPETLRDLIAHAPPLLLSLRI